MSSNVTLSFNVTLSSNATLTSAATFQPPSGGGGGNGGAPYVAHGLLMISAWQLMASIGLLVARFYKPGWPKRQLFSAQIWFFIHRVCMVLTLLLDVAGFILVFATAKTYVGTFFQIGYQQAHPAIGIVVTTLVLANPIMALFRCTPDDIRRPWFTWFHLYVGYIAYILGTINIFFGLALHFSFSGEIPSVYWLMGTSMVFHIFSEAVLQTHSQLRAWQLAYRQKERQKAAAAAAAAAAVDRLEDHEIARNLKSDGNGLQQRHRSENGNGAHDTTGQQDNDMISNGFANVARVDDVTGRDYYGVVIATQDPTGHKYDVTIPKSDDMLSAIKDEVFSAKDYKFIYGYLLFYSAVVIGLWVAIVVIMSLSI